jgi:hypothetical protein
MKIRYERRFTCRTVDLTMWQSVKIWWRTGNFSRQKTVFDEVSPNDPAYADAPYAEAFFYSQKP